MKILFILYLASAISVQANDLIPYNDSLKDSGNRPQGGDSLEEGNEWENETDRSLSQHFFIKMEGNLILLSADKQIDDFSIQIKDAQGCIVYTEAHLSLPAEGVCPILADDWADGQYTALLRQGRKQVVCWFTK